jgi:hypothetical protein
LTQSSAVSARPSLVSRSGPSGLSMIRVPIPAFPDQARQAWRW